MRCELSNMEGKQLQKIESTKISKQWKCNQKRFLCYLKSWYEETHQLEEVCWTNPDCYHRVLCEICPPSLPLS